MTVIKLKPFVSRGEVFALPDGTITTMPVQLFKTDVSIVMRVGDTCYFFTHEGVYDGPELHLKNPRQAEQAAQLLAETQGNIGKQPETAYFQVGSRGYDAEMAPFKKH